MGAEKRWWVRIVTGGGYGRWVPTPETDLEMAKFYIRSIYNYEGYAREWMLL